MINKLKKGINIINLTLHVNGGTFIPIKSEFVEDHLMHYEDGFISKNAAKKLIFLKTEVEYLLLAQQY